MAYRLRENLHWCLCGERVIFLDLEADRYFCLSSAAGAAFIKLAAGDVTAETSRLQRLSAHGMLIEDPAAAGLRAAARVRAATADLLQEPWPMPRIRDLTLALACEARVAWQLRRGGLLRAAKEAEARERARNVPPREPDIAVRRIVSAFAAVTLVVPAADRCLVRALALHAACCRQGICPRLVFGVRTDPFRAHCWVQLEEHVLIGDFERARLFTPILVVG